MAEPGVIRVAKVLALKRSISCHILFVRPRVGLPEA